MFAEPKVTVRGGYMSFTPRAREKKILPLPEPECIPATDAILSSGRLVQKRKKRKTRLGLDTNAVWVDSRGVSPAEIFLSHF